MESLTPSSCWGLPASLKAKGLALSLCDFLQIAETLAGRPESVEVREFAPGPRIPGKNAPAAEKIFSELEAGGVARPSYAELREVSEAYRGGNWIDVQLNYRESALPLRIVANDSSAWEVYGEPRLTEQIAREAFRRANGDLLLMVRGAGGVFREAS